MRRAPYVAGATMLGMVGILTFHSQGAPSALLAVPKAQASAKSPATTTPSAPPPTSAGPPSGQTGSTSTTMPATTAARTATGPNEQYGYGMLAVKVTVAGTKITGVSVPNLQTADQYSQQLAQQVIPMLRSEVLKAQSARINGITGATYTAQAYVTSLQAALNNLHFH
ncbi:MAG: FMN-binding protein [Acidimicrobiales bacterium]